MRHHRALQEQLSLRSKLEGQGLEVWLDTELRKRPEGHLYRSLCQIPTPKTPTKRCATAGRCISVFGVYWTHPENLTPGLARSGRAGAGLRRAHPIGLGVLGSLRNPAQQVR
jgi:hypothetical protein